MSSGPQVRVFIGSIGRRVYLIRWFVEAFERLGIDGQLHVSDADARSAGMLSSSFRHVVPRYEDAGYSDAMAQTFEAVRPHLFFSVNDYEIEALATTGLAARLEEHGTVVLSLATDRHAAIHDKYAMSVELRRYGVPTPETVPLSHFDEALDLATRAQDVIVKERCGSGSSGLEKLTSTEFISRMQMRDGGWPQWSSSERVVQPLLSGVEFGLDIVSPVLPDAHATGVLAREKLRMRAGETDQAESVESEPFFEVATHLARWLGHRGLVDVDVIVDDHGVQHVIDINPRFGGGYPFNHLAGADIPGLYVAQLVGHRGDALGLFLNYASGVISSKFEAVVRDDQGVSS
ncbi:carbamoyl phosphate synthase [Pseudoclavibacter endophyticus]|nr:ATP-grasp domain-containing protein [Pseudoclavibacter endophyticus]GGA71440.1 carbamoyl phosphate synthase [Pseudoclavibacter endophyticus]